MTGTPFPIPKSSTPGARPGEGEGRLFNCYAVTEGDRSYVRLPRGLTALADTAKTGIRGMLDVNGVLYVVYTGSVVTVSGATVTTLTGSIPGSDGVTIVRNNKVTGGASTPDVVAVRESGGAYVLTSSAVSAYPDADLPATVNSVDFLGGYFLFSIPDGRFFASDLNTTAVNALSFTTAEARADGLRRVVVLGALAYAMGGSTIEPYQNVGTSPFPLQRGTTVLPVGIMTTMAVAGFQEAWGGALYFVASDGSVKTLSGYDTETISTPDVDRFIAASTVATLDVTAFVWQGRSFVSVSSDAGTWVYDIALNSWHERGAVTYSAETGISTARWKAKYSTYSGEKWVFGDATSGNLLVMSPTATDGAGFLQTGPLKDFPADIEAKLNAEFSQADLTIYVSWSGNGGRSWSTELSRSIAEADAYSLGVANLGKSSPRGFMVRFRWQEPDDFSFMGATATRVEARNR